ncbi:MAG: recombinase family protein [Sediminibacterium sp.]|jgi:site-specific DNA recombinase|uniref:recombinase family protein n=1 Tax=Sediminibacterium sp. TaxID=1917865 RepID=UPI002AB90D40|nr:recombinase family protein [Sediminibacterium sp.]MDZ4072002.1 recombinase family protein [Sediminibacterium sp.]
MKKALLYTRVSTDEQAKTGFSLENQIRSLRKYCKDNDILAVKHYEEDFSGKSFDRPKWKELRRYIREHKKTIDLILFTRWDRLSRNMSDSMNLIYEMKELGIELRAIEQEGYNSENPESIYGFAITLASAQVEREKISIRTKASYYTAKIQGRYLGKIPLGYKYEKDEAKKSILIIDKPTAAFIRDTFELYAQGNHSILEVMRIMMQKHNRKPMAKQTFINLLKNRIYVGDIVIKPYKGEPEQIVNGTHESIVSRETFEKVQWNLNARKRQKNIRKPNDERLILRRFLLCPECGKSMTGCATKKRKHPYYQCQKGHYRFNAHKVNDRFIEIISADFGKNMHLLPMYKSLLEETYYQNKAQITAEIESLDKSIKKCIENKEEKFNDYVNGRISPEAYNECFNRLESKERDWVTERTELEMGLKYDFKRYVEHSIPIIENIPYYFKNGDTDTRIRLLNTILDGKMVFKDGDYQTLNYNPAISLMLNIDKGFEEKEKGQITKSVPFSSKAPKAGLEPATL